MATPTLEQLFGHELAWSEIRTGLSLLALALTLLFVYLVAFVPHLQGDGYPLPLHMDEWLHLGKTAALAEQGTTGYANRWFGGTASASGGVYHEVGFHVLLAQIHMVTGIDLVTIYTYGPGVVLALTAFGAYALGKPHGYGHEAALFVALIPTSVRFLGPAFLVPISFAFPWIVLAFLLAFRADRPRDAAPLLIVVVATWMIHARAAGFVTLPVVAAGLFRLRSDWRTGAAVAAAGLAPLVFALPLFLDRATANIILEQRLPIQRAFFDNFGLGTLVLFGLGAVFAARDVVEKHWEPILLVASAMFAFLFIFSRTIYHVNLFTMYSRAHMLFFVTAAPVAGYGLSRVLRLGLRSRNLQKAIPTARILAVLLALLAITPALAQHQQERYYHVVTEDDVETFRWMDENLAPKYEKALMLPWKGLAYGAVTGREPATVQFPADTVSGTDVAFRFLRSGGQDVQLLRRNQIGVVYTTQVEIDHPELREVHENVYVLLPPEAGD